jgi:hypothetical protein
MTELELVDKYALQNSVIELHLKGIPAYTIAKQLKIKTPVVQAFLEDWRKVAANDTEIKSRAREALAGMDKHYNMIISKLWEAVEECDLAGDIKTKNSILKNIADIEAKRLDSLQKAGLLDDQEVGNQVVQTQKKLDQVKELLKEVSSKCPQCRVPVAQGIGRIWNEATVINIESTQI